AFVDYPSPIRDILVALEKINTFFSPALLFTKLENDHLRLPVENTKKALCDCSSEIYKLVGPDALSQKVMKDFLCRSLNTSVEELKHAESGRPLSSIQLLELIEAKLSIEPRLTKVIREVGTFRTDADHKIIKEEVRDENHVDAFLCLCSRVADSLNHFFINARTVSLST